MKDEMQKTSRWRIWKNLNWNQQRDGRVKVNLSDASEAC